jgi:hypothetical protein
MSIKIVLFFWKQSANSLSAFEFTMGYTDLNIRAAARTITVAELKHEKKV